MYRITTYMKVGQNNAGLPPNIPNPLGWDKVKKYLYDDPAIFHMKVKYHKNSMGKGWSNSWRVIAEEYQNGQWVVIEDWVQP